MSLEGRIIEFLDSDHGQLRIAYVRKQERDRLHIIDPKGRNLSVNDAHVVIIHSSTAEDDFPTVARQISEKVAARQSEVDTELLWLSLDGKQREVASEELAELFFADGSAEAASAIFRALLNDDLFFKLKGTQFLPKTASQVSTERTRRQRQREREETREQLSSSIHRLLKTNALPKPEDQPILDRIQNWMRSKSGDEVGSLLESAVGTTKAREAAYDILARSGRIDLSMDRFLVLAGLQEHFAPQLLEAAGRLDPFHHTEERLDYRDVPAVTIDDEDTLEVDDALTVRRSGSETILGIHIADVSAFVKKGDLLDDEASRRSSTVYLPTTTVPMFPERLSTDLGSLKSGVDRPAFTVEVRFDEQGTQLGYRIARTTIHVETRLSYDQADTAIEAGDVLLQTLCRIADQLHRSRAERGAITFRRPELKIRVHDGDIQLKKIDPRSPSRFLVSELMILANGLAADFASVNGLPVIYRTQEPREAAVIEDTSLSDALAFERIRKTFKRSRLSLTPGLHSGLGLGAYTQASSPIRRYADLITQRQFTARLKGEPLPHTREELLQILTTAEAVEQEIRSLEDRSMQYWLLEYLSRYKREDLLQAIVLDSKGAIELEEYVLRGKVSTPDKLQPGQVISVRIEQIEPLRGEIRFKPA